MIITHFNNQHNRRTNSSPRVHNIYFISLDNILQIQRYTWFYFVAKLNVQL